MPRILTATGPAASPSAGLTFQNIETRDNEVDRLMAPDSFGGFSSLGHFCRTAARVQMTKGALGDTTDRDIWRSWINAYSRYHNHLADIERGRRTRTDIVRAITTPDGMFETSEPDGGALVPPGFVREVFFKAMYRVTPFSTCKIVPVMSNAGALPAIAETSRVDGSRWGGLQSFWEGEAQPGTKTWPRLLDANYRLKKCYTLVPFVTELFEDTDLLDAFLTEAVHREFLYQMNNTIVHGTGVGEALGVVKAPCTITVAKDSGQAAATISPSNCSNMWTSFWGPSRANAHWWANDEFDPDALTAATAPTQTLPLTGWREAVEAPTIKGRPVWPLENCSAIGTPGDIILGDFSQVLLVMKGLRKDISMHFKFDSYQSYGRFIYRVDLLPLWQAPITPANGTKVKSPLVVLAQRS